MKLSLQRGSKMDKKINNQLDEAFKHIKPYIKDQKDLCEMCKHCERFCGKEHDYEECLNMMCFKFYLAYVYLDWCNNSDGY